MRTSKSVITTAPHDRSFEVKSNLECETLLWPHDRHEVFPKAFAMPFSHLNAFTEGMNTARDFAPIESGNIANPVPSSRP